MLVQFLVHEGRLYQRLTIVEDTIYLDSGNVLPQCGKLALLDGRNLTFGIEHINVDALYAQESVGHCATCVAAGSYEHVD